VSQLLRHESNEWDEGTLRRYFFHWDMEEIMKITLPVNKRSDWFARQYKKTGIFSVRSVYKLALTRDHDLDAVGTSASASGERSVWKKIWKLQFCLRCVTSSGKCQGMDCLPMQTGAIGISRSGLLATSVMLSVRTTMLAHLKPLMLHPCCWL
jgi:hypothetical protein